MILAIDCVWSVCQCCLICLDQFLQNFCQHYMLNVWSRLQLRELVYDCGDCSAYAYKYMCVCVCVCVCVLLLLFCIMVSISVLGWYKASCSPHNIPSTTPLHPPPPPTPKCPPLPTLIFPPAVNTVSTSCESGFNFFNNFFNACSINQRHCINYYFCILQICIIIGICALYVFL